MQRREHITAPYRCYNGRIITCQAHIDNHNRIQDDINIWIDAKREVPEWLLDWSHRNFVAIAELGELPCQTP